MYQLDVVELGSLEADQFESEAQKANTLGSTGGPQGRRYGYW